MTPFGDDASPQEITYREIVEKIKGMTPRALTAASLDSAITLVEWLRDEGLKRHDINQARIAELDVREKALDKRARDLKIHERAVAAVMKNNAPRRIAYFWR